MLGQIFIPHARAWRNDSLYRWLWLLAPQMLALLFIVWLFDATPTPPVGGNSGSWWNDPNASRNELYVLSTKAATDPAAETELRKRAETGNSEAEFYLAYFLDPLVNKNLATDDRTRECLEWYKKSAAHGSPGAAANYGLLKAYPRGSSFPADYAEALKYLQMAGNNPMAMRELAFMYSSGRGVPMDQKHANELLQNAADMNDKDAQYWLGEDYDKGEHGQPQDKAKALVLWQKSAFQGRREAQREFGLHLFSGDGIQKNNDQAVYWLKLAASNGDQPAQQFLQTIHQN